jgi:hypothetical protein
MGRTGGEVGCTGGEVGFTGGAACRRVTHVLDAKSLSLLCLHSIILSVSAAKSFKGSAMGPYVSSSELLCNVHASARRICSHSNTSGQAHDNACQTNMKSPLAAVLQSDTLCT